MSDVDAVRWMASEHDLEFVDLDSYGVDTGAREILPASLSRRHHVVAIKRKFGTPVIATADPDDLSAQDSVRASIGRDFISVVATRDQISQYLNQLFGTAELDGERNGTEVAGRTSSSGFDFDPRLESAPSLEEFLPVEPEPVQSNADVESGDPDLEASSADAAIDGDATSGKQSTGKRRRRRDEVKQKVGKSESGVGADAEALDVSRPSEELNASPVRFATEPADQTSADPMSGPRSDFSEPNTELTSESDRDIQFLPTEAAPVDVFDEAALRVTPETEPVEYEHLEPSTSVLPVFGSSLEDADWAPDAGGTTEPDPLAELARSVEDGEQQQGTDSTDLAADLVAEAVATYQQKHGDEQQRYDTTILDVPTGSSFFPPLAKVLVDGGRVSLEDMETVLEEHYRTGQTIARILTAQDLVTEADLMWGMAEEMGLDFIDLDSVGVDFTEAGTIPEATARHHNVIVIANDDGTPVVAASNPTDVFAMDDLRTIMGRNFIVVVATRSQISSYIGRAFNSGGDAADMAMEASLGIDGSQTHADVDDIQSVTEEAPIVRYVNLLILQALNERASDIHVEPTPTELRIRYRIDGVLHDVSTAPRTISSAVITRLKVMADMNVAEHRIPQDGRISLNVGSKGIDLRIATLPTIHGEKCVMRVLDKSSVVLGFSDLGFDEDLLSTYEGLYTKPYGTILVTGPTGSGKSTTLYTTLTALNSPEKNIITVEDPVELQLKGVNQVQLNVKAGLTFASALRSILRADPDIVLVGEIRDKETAVIAIEAALTGHMVLATLHTNSAAATPMRLIEMGLEPFLVTSALSGVLAQRLARRLCVHCKEAYEPTEADITAAGWSTQEVEKAGGITKVFRSVGCSACANTGYRGRKALAELLPLTEEIERSIIEGGSVEDIHKIAVAQGMVTLRQSGLRKAIEGETTLEEVLRVVA
jgi:type IV pilus assembly protein PilB